MSDQQQLFPDRISSVTIRAEVWPDGRLHVLASVAVGRAAAWHQHDTYALCTDDELHDVVDATLGALFVRALHTATLNALVLDEPQ